MAVASFVYTIFKLRIHKYFKWVNRTKFKAICDKTVNLSNNICK